MEKLNRAKLLNGITPPADVKVGPLTQFPERILQFGEGAFLRAFVDWMVDEMNSAGKFGGSVVVVQPIAHGMVDMLNGQDGLYTLLLRGIHDDVVITQKQLITAVSRGINPYTEWAGYLATAEQPELRFVISNTTEAGIHYVSEGQPTDKCPTSFPAKLTAFLYHRFQHFAGAADKGMLIIPCELIDRNGDHLRDIVKRYAAEWALGAEFTAWVDANCPFFNTLVDRIVTGYPRKEAETLAAELGYLDDMLDTGEIFHLWVIEGEKKYAAELPFTEVGLNVLWTDNMEPYRTRKVRILNGAHTMTVLAAYLRGINTVQQCIEDPQINAYMKKGIFDEILPILDLPEQEKHDFAAAVFERFDNPFIKHMLLSISHNSVSKFKVRVLPSILEYLALRGELPRVLTFSLAALIAFYRGTEIVEHAIQGKRGETSYQIKDGTAEMEFFTAAWRNYAVDADIDGMVQTILGAVKLWGKDLNSVPGLTAHVTSDLRMILVEGIASAIGQVIE